MQVIDTNTTAVRTDGLQSTTVDDDLVVLNLRTNNYISIDRVGRRVWELLEKPTRVGDLIAALAEEFEADPSIVEADVTAFLGELDDEGMVKLTPASASTG